MYDNPVDLHLLLPGDERLRDIGIVAFQFRDVPDRPDDHLRDLVRHGLCQVLPRPAHDKRGTDRRRGTHVDVVGSQGNDGSCRLRPGVHESVGGIGDVLKAVENEPLGIPGETTRCIHVEDQRGRPVQLGLLDRAIHEVETRFSRSQGVLPHFQNHYLARVTPFFTATKQRGAATLLSLRIGCFRIPALILPLGKAFPVTRLAVLPGRESNRLGVQLLHRKQFGETLGLGLREQGFPLELPDRFPRRQREDLSLRREYLLPDHHFHFPIHHRFRNVLAMPVLTCEAPRPRLENGLLLCRGPLSGRRIGVFLVRLQHHPGTSDDGRRMDIDRVGRQGEKGARAGGIGIYVGNDGRLRLAQGIENTLPLARRP